MRSLPDRRGITTTVVLLLAVIAAGFAANAALRPGCSLLPVTAPDDPSSRSQPASPEQACAVLGRPLPHARVLPDGVRETTTYIAWGASDGVPGMVTVGYAKDGRGIGILQLVKADAIPTGNAGAVNSTVAGVPAIVDQVRLASIDAEDVHYLWVRDGLLFSLHVQLAPGITREAADAMAASIR